MKDFYQSSGENKPNCWKIVGMLLEVPVWESTLQ